MRKALRWFGWSIGGLLVIALLFAAWVWFASARVLARSHDAAPERLGQPSAAQLADGERQARILGCHSCHGEGMAGRMMFDGGPFATVWAPNLPELAARVSDQQFAQAIRQGIGHDGRALYIMPSGLFSRLNDEEVAALIAHIRSLPNSGAATPGIQWGPTPDITSPGLDIAAAYDRAQFHRLMRTGIGPSGRDLGLMREVAVDDLRHYTDAEIDQIFFYLQARAARVQDPPRAEP